jgi:hypothetical protein
MGELIIVAGNFDEVRTQQVSKPFSHVHIREYLSGIQLVFMPCKLCIKPGMRGQQKCQLMLI